MTRLYGVFTPQGELIAAFKDYKAADAMASYQWDKLRDPLYWSMAPQPPTIASITVEADPPADPHSIKEVQDRNYSYCTTWDCPRHGLNAKRAPGA